MPPAGAEVTGEDFSASVTADAASEGLELLVTYRDGRRRGPNRVRGRARGGDPAVRGDAGGRRADPVDHVPQRGDRRARVVACGIELADAAAGEPLDVLGLDHDHMARRWRHGRTDRRTAWRSRSSPAPATSSAGSLPRRRRSQRSSRPRSRASQGSNFVANLGGQQLEFHARRARAGLPHGGGGLHGRVDAGTARRRRPDPRGGPRPERGLGHGRGPGPGARTRGAHPRDRAGGRADHRRARATPAVARRRDELRGGRRRPRTRRARRGGRPVLRPAPSRVRVRLAARDGDRSRTRSPASCCSSRA